MTNYSTDTDLKSYEPDILDHLPDTTPTTTNFDTQHSEAKRIIDEMILKRLPEGVRTQIKNGTKTMNDVVDENDLQTISVFFTLFLIFNWISTKKGDIYDIKAQNYYELFKEKIADLSFDISLDTEASDFEEEIDMGGIEIFRG